ncbi:MAG: hypothetical protein ACREE1_15030, partial [Stellaceae bacterium]
MFGFGKKREATQLPPKAAYDLGETIGRCLFRAVAGYLDYRLSQLTVKVLALLAERFETIHDEPNHKSEVVAQVEFHIFRDNLQERWPRLESEIRGFLNDWLLIAEKSNQKVEIDEYISDRLS